MRRLRLWKGLIREGRIHYGDNMTGPLKETEILELKRSTAELKEAVISISAILNKHGKGELFFGVNNAGVVIGQKISSKTLRDISQAISEHIQPKIYPEIEHILMEGKDCIRVKFSGNDAPYYAYGRVYMRVADEDRALSPMEIEKIIMKRTGIEHTGIPGLQISPMMILTRMFSGIL